MAGKKKNKSKPKRSGAKAGPDSQGDAATENAIVELVKAESAEMARNAGIATAEESVISGVVEASLESSKQENQEAQQGDDDGDDDIGIDAIKDDQGATGVDKCDHVKNTVKVKDFRHLKIKDWEHCHECQELHALGQKPDPEEATGDSAESLPTDALWMCMSCQSINCGSTSRKHAKAHHQAKGHDHPIAINLASLDCWCYECDDMLITSNNKNRTVSECRALLEKELRNRQAKMRKTRDASATHAKKSKGAVVSTPTPAAAPVKAKIHTPGLQNLGNTCFFNSVMQILAETKSLRAILSEKGRASFHPSLAAETDSGLGPLTTTFKDFLFTTWKQQGGKVTPRDLFTQIAKKWRVFRGFRQQDSQELMRHLFDGIREEEQELIKKIAEENPTKDDANSPPKYLPFIDSCFAGKLVSVIVCHSCKKCSYAYEDYFDLSLPVKGPPAPTGGSQLDILRHKAKARSEGFQVSTTPDPDDKYPIPKDDQGSEAHLRHVEMLLKNVSPKGSSEELSIARSLNQFTSVDCLEGENKFACGNCYKLIKSYGTAVVTDQNDEAAEEKQQTEMESAVDETKVETEDEEDGSKDSTSEPDTDRETPDNGDAVASTSKDTKANAEKSPEPEFIFRKAYKRYLVSSLPPTLVLHLKRFEQTASRFGLMRKIDDHVEIPTEIDMEPYCISQSQLVEEPEKPAESDSKEKVSRKYRLYGATVHQGSLASGHYTNYVLSSKVDMPPRPAEKDKGSSVPEPPAITSNGLPDVSLADMLAQPSKKKGKKKGNQAKAGGGTNTDAAVAAPSAADKQPDADKGPTSSEPSAKSESKEEEADGREWIYCSDTHVRLASLQEVLASRPYLLYYERC